MHNPTAFVILVSGQKGGGGGGGAHASYASASRLALKHGRVGLHLKQKLYHQVIPAYFISVSH